MIDYLVEVWDWQKQDWYLIKAFRYTNSITEINRLNAAQTLADSLTIKYQGLIFRINQVPN